MEQVKPKKPKTKKKPPQTAAQSASPAVINGLALPDAPTHSLQGVERSATPEPEEM